MERALENSHCLQWLTKSTLSFFDTYFFSLLGEIQILDSCIAQKRNPMDKMFVFPSAVDVGKVPTDFNEAWVWSKTFYLHKVEMSVL